MGHFRWLEKEKHKITGTYPLQASHARLHLKRVVHAMQFHKPRDGHIELCVRSGLYHMPVQQIVRSHVCLRVRGKCGYHVALDISSNLSPLAPLAQLIMGKDGEGQGSVIGRSGGSQGGVKEVPFLQELTI
eukprot:1157850-Pelagomonas_calceolata.AAC.21